VTDFCDALDKYYAPHGHMMAEGDSFYNADNYFQSISI